ncbi:SDR family NAD(P)-dependent oxidoreductase [Halostella sp. PRR32]|uniref:SDR family NAD(P)-dependent oxidoreductase n=1 Tax=Halostella sp. PRR32 TaxID=3098147 RepID=UPI002B1E302B|nr:SDR family NAD(P)-dependent oxidoreductase [Halostella sp. PRR32]
MGQTTFDFTDETVIVTGGSSGIGRAIATAFGDAGATVIVADLREEPKDVDADLPTHEAIEDAGGHAEFVRTDVSAPDEVRSLVEAAREFGGVDVMVNNAGVFGGGSIRETDPTELDRLLGVNVRGVFVGCQVAANDMIERDDPGAIVNTASISSNLAQHGQVAYDTSKGAVRMITRGAALELAEDGIRVNGIAPGQIATEIDEGWTEEAEGGDFLKPVPQGRAGRPEDLAGAALFLASEQAGYVTGELVHVDGGWQIC